MAYVYDNPLYKNTADADNFDVTMAMRDKDNNLIYIVIPSEDEKKIIRVIKI